MNTGTGTCLEKGEYEWAVKVAAFEPLARGRVNKIILSQTNQTLTFHIQIKYV